MIAPAVLPFVLLAPSWAGPPREPPPPRGTIGGPPPAWIETSSSAAWLAYSNSCWKVCVDFIPPRSRTDVPAISVDRGRSVRFHLAFTPRVMIVQALGQPAPAMLPPHRIVQWRPRASTRLILSARRGPFREASYVVDVVVR